MLFFRDNRHALIPHLRHATTAIQILASATNSAFDRPRQAELKTKAFEDESRPFDTCVCRRFVILLMMKHPVVARPSVWPPNQQCGIHIILLENQYLNTSLTGQDTPTCESRSDTQSKHVNDCAMRRR
jgi:hypothetical protein